MTLMFQQRFVDLVRSGQKVQTIRKPKRIPTVGTAVSLRQWSGLPYRSKQEVIGTGELVEVLPIKLSKPQFDETVTISIGGNGLYLEESEAFAKADGFSDLAEMYLFFRDVRGLTFENPFFGWLYRWRLDGTKN